MASFTDQGIQFNPYIQQLPVDEYTRTGIISQQQYNEGVQRVQGYFDTIGGLPVVGDANKAILSEKLAALKNSVQGMIGADFGKMNLQMQIGSLATQIAKDPAIQTSVEAAKKIQALEASIAEARKSGKGYSAANEWAVRNYVNQYVAASNKEAGISYGGPTSIHNVTEDDVHKKWQEAIKSFKGAENVDVSIGGSGEIMVKSTDKTVDADRIQAALQAITTADDFKALQISGAYKFQGASDEEVVNSANKYYGEIVKERQQYSDFYANAANSTEGLSDEDKRKYLLLSKRHANVAERYKTLINDNLNSYKEGKVDLERIAGTLNYESIINGYSGAYSFSQKDYDKKVAPEWEVAKSKVELELRRREVAAKEKEANPTIPNPGQITMPADPDEAEETTKEKFENEKMKAASDAEQMNIQAMTDLIVGSPNWSQQKDDPNAPVTKDGKIKPEKLKELQVLAEETTKGIQTAATSPDHGVVPNYNSKFGSTLNRKRDLEFKRQNLNELDNQIMERLRRTAPNVAEALDKNQPVKLKDGTTITVKEAFDIFFEGTVEKQFVPIGAVASVKPSTTRETVKGSRLEKIGRDKIVEVLNKYKVKESDLNFATQKEYEKLGEIYNTKLVPFDELKTSKNPYLKVYENVVRGRLPKAGITKDILGEDFDISSIDVLNEGSLDIVGGRVNDKGRTELLVTVKTGKDTSQQVWVDVNDYAQSVKSDKNSFLTKYLAPDTNPELTRAIRLTNTGTPLNEKDGFKGSKFTVNPHAMRNYKIDIDPSTGEYFAMIAVPQKSGGFIYKELRPGVYNAGSVEEIVNQFYSQYNPKTSSFKSLSAWEEDIFKRSELFNLTK